MKKITFSHTTKRVVMFAGLAVACVAALSLVYSRVNAAQPTKVVSSASSGQIVLASPNSITVPPISSSPSSDTGSAFVPSSGAVSSKPLTVVSKPSSQPPKPKPPASSALTNKAKKPSYSSKPTASSKAITDGQPKNGDVKNGKTYVDGFGWVDGTGGGKAENSPDVGGDIHKQVGTMD